MSLISDIHNDLEDGAIRLITEYRARLFGDAVRLCGNAADADDLVSRTFVKVISKIDQHKSDGDFYGWMKAILVNLHRNDLERPVARGTVPVDDVTLEQYAGADDSTMEQLMRNSDHDALREAINELDPEYRQSVAMYYFSELSLKEIASFLDSSTSSVSRKLQIARKILAAKLSARLGKARKPVAVLAALLLSLATAFGAWKVADALGWLPTNEEPQVTEAPTEDNAPETALVPVQTPVTLQATDKTISATTLQMTASDNAAATPTDSKENERTAEMNLKTVKTMAVAATTAALATTASAETAIPASAYVQEGLVAQFDGVENAGVGTHEYFAAPDAVDDETKTCLTESTAGTITNAMARATADGDVVTLLPGTYDMSKFVPRNGLFFDVTKQITVRSKDGDPLTVTLKGAGTAQLARCFNFKDTTCVLCGVSLSGFYYESTTDGLSLVSKGTIRNCIFSKNSKSGYSGTCVANSICYDCKFEDNVCTNTAVYRGGIGLFGKYYSCQFERNEAYGPIRQSYGGALVAPLHVSNCVFVANHSKNNAGAIVAFQGSEKPPANVSCLIERSWFTNNWAMENGGAVYGGTVSNCVFYGCSTIECRGLGGGAVCSVDAVDCVFEENVVTVRVHNVGGGAASQGTYRGCRFARNKTVTPSGHMHVGGTLFNPKLVDHCVVVNSAAKRGGAIYANGASVIQNSWFTNNTAEASGGSIYGGVVSNCVVFGSVAKGDAGGGGVYNVLSYNTLYENNSSTRSASSKDYGGGGQAGGCAINCIFRGNSEEGKAIAGACGNVAMTNCLVYGNKVNGQSDWGGCIVYSGKSCVNSTIVSNNVAAGYGACAGTFVNCIMVDNGPCDVWDCTASSATLTTRLTNCIYSTVHSSSQPSVIVGSRPIASISVVKFESYDIASTNGFRLTRQSPARDFGFDVGLTEADSDLGGQARVYGKAIDAGCYECHIPVRGLLIFVR